VSAPVIDFRRRRIGEETMSPNDMALLRVFIANPGRVVEPREFPWGHVATRSLYAAIRRLRLKGVPIETVRGHGFMLDATPSFEVPPREAVH
jgi:DNA-binding response OmpR family regulator